MPNNNDLSTEEATAAEALEAYAESDIRATERLNNIFDLEPTPPTTQCTVPCDVPVSPRSSGLTRRTPSEEDRRRDIEWRTGALEHGQIIDVFTKETCYLGVKCVRYADCGIGFIQEGIYHFMPWHNVKEISTPVMYNVEE